MLVTLGLSLSSCNWASYFSYKMTDCGPEKRGELAKKAEKIAEERKKFPGNVEVTRTVKDGCETYQVKQSSVLAFWEESPEESSSEDVESEAGEEVIE